MVRSLREQLADLRSPAKATELADAEIARLQARAAMADCRAKEAAAIETEIVRIQKDKAGRVAERQVELAKVITALETYIG